MRLSPYYSCAQLADPRLLPELQFVHAQAAYRTFVRNAKFVTASNAGHVHFLGACVVELFGRQPEQAYQHAFSHLSELAQLR